MHHRFSLHLGIALLVAFGCSSSSEDADADRSGSKSSTADSTRPKKSTSKDARTPSNTDTDTDTDSDSNSPSGGDSPKTPEGNRWAPIASGVTTTLAAVWGFAEDDVFAVGDNGVILHYDGKAWVPENSGAPKSSLTAVFGTSPSDVWALGKRNPSSGDTEEVILRRRGGVWSKVVPSIALQTPMGIWGSAADGIFFYGATTIRFKDEQWTATGALPILDEIRALCGVGTGSTIELFGGGRIQLGGGAVVGTYGANSTLSWQYSDPAQGELFPMTEAILCVSPTEVYAAGGGEVFRYTPGVGTAKYQKAWRSMASDKAWAPILGKMNIGHFWRDGSVLYAVGSHGFVGRIENGVGTVEWSRADTYLLGVWGTSGHLFAVGQKGAIVERR